MYNHIGHFAEGQHALCKSLFFGGVTRRFPDLAFAFLEGGVAWAVTLYADLSATGRSATATRSSTSTPPASTARCSPSCSARYGAPPSRGRGATGARRLARARRRTRRRSTSCAACEIERAEDIRDLFVPRFFFGCEADDPLTATAFNTKVNPFGARLQRCSAPTSRTGTSPT